MAAAPKKGSAKTKTKATAKSVQKTPAEQTPIGDAINEVREKRAAMDQPVVDTPVMVTEGGETEPVDSKDRVELVPEGSTARLSIGSKSVLLDGEAVKSLQRHLTNVAAGM